MSYEISPSTAPKWPMAKAQPTDAEFREEFIERTKRAREASGYTQEQMAGFLGIDQGRYKQYETRSALPHVFIAKFCLLCRCEVHWLLTGLGKEPEPAPGVTPQARQTPVRSRGRRA